MNLHALHCPRHKSKKQQQRKKLLLILNIAGVLSYAQIVDVSDVRLTTDREFQKRRMGVVRVEMIAYSGII